MLRQREEVLEICYWYQGEGFGESFTPAALQSFLPLATERIAEIMQALTVDGDLAAQGHGFQLTMVVFLFVFVAGVFADLLETQQSLLVTAGLCGLLSASAIWNLLQLARLM